VFGIYGSKVPLELAAAAVGSRLPPRVPYIVNGFIQTAWQVLLTTSRWRARFDFSWSNLTTSAKRCSVLQNHSVAQFWKCIPGLPKWKMIRQLKLIADIMHFMIMKVNTLILFI
jgi:hypothetical protein